MIRNYKQDKNTKRNWNAVNSEGYHKHVEF